MSGKNPVFYWDSCIYLAWLRKEVAYATSMPSMEAIADLNQNGKATIITSVVLLAETQSHKLTPEQERDFMRCFEQRRHIIYDVDPAIARKARELRDYYVKNPIRDRHLSTPDAIHIATALIYQATEFHTFDNGKKRDDEGKKGIPLLELGDTVAGYPLKICRPFIEHQPSLV